MFAIIETGGKQFRVEKGEKIKVEKLDAKEGEKITFDQVLLIADGKKVDLGKPVVSGAVVSAKVLRHDKDKKITVFKFKAKKRYQKKQGHRQHFSEVEILEIGAAKKTIKEVKAKTTTKTVKAAAPKKAPAKKAATKK